MKSLIAIIALSFSLSSMASVIQCKSANYEMVSDDDGANYSVNGNPNDGADVEVGEMYISKNIIAFSLTVDGQKEKFEVSATKSGKHTYTGKIFASGKVQTAKCTLE